MATDNIKRAAEAHFTGLMVFVTALKQRDRRRGGANLPKTDNQALDSLIGTFEKAARGYFRKAQSLITNDSNQASNYQSSAYYEVLSRLTEHSLLLSDLARPHLEADFDDQFKQFNPCNSSLTGNRALIEKIMTIISTRFTLRSPSAVIFPISSLNFQFIHFNYMDGLGIVGIPPEVLTTPSWNLSVLWHEIAGYEVARISQAGKLEDWIKEISLDTYQRVYEQSVLDNLAAEIEPREPAASKEPCPYRIVECDKIAGYLAQKEWQADWLAEFFEDLFGVQALGGAMIEALADALAQRYDNFALGDDKHPSPNARLQVALAYLDLIAPSIPNNDPRKATLFDLGKVRTYPKERFGNSYEPDSTAKAIAQFYKGKVEAKEFSSPDISPEEKLLAKAVGDVHNQFFRQENPLLLKEVLQKLCSQLKNLSIPDIKTSFTESLDKFRQEVNSAQDLGSLLDIQFADADMFGSWRRRRPIIWPPPRWPR